MLIHQVMEQTGLTKKAIEYYIEQGLISPNTLENGYRDFSTEQMECLKKISVLRKLGLNTENIRAVLCDTSTTVLQKLSVQKELTLQKEVRRKALLETLSTNADYAQIETDLKALEQSESIACRLLDTFPGYYGKFICLHFASFLNAPITTPKQQNAYEEIIAFLDNAATLEFPKDVQEYLDENTNRITVEQLQNMIHNTRHSVENPEEFLSENKEFLEKYQQYVHSEQFKQSAAYKFRNMLLEFNQTSGYYDIFIPAMKRLSPAYAEYQKQLETANQKLLEQYPEFQKL